MLEVCFSAHPNIQYRTFLLKAVTCVRSVQVIVEGSGIFRIPLFFAISPEPVRIIGESYGK